MHATRSHAEALVAHASVRDAARRAGFGRIEGVALRGLAWLAVDRGDASAARALFAEAEVLKPAPREDVSAWAGRAEIARLEGRAEEACRHFAAAIAVAARPVATIPHEVGMAVAEIESGRPDDGARRAGAALELALEHGVGSVIGGAAAALLLAAAVRRRPEEWDRACAWHLRALDGAGTASSMQARLALATGRAWDAAGDPARAVRSWQIALWHARRVDLADLVADARAALEGAVDRAPIPLAGFDLYEPIGRGGFGVVWRAVRRSDGQTAAVKVLTHQAARQPRRVSAFETEIRTVSRLVHPWIARVWEYGSADEVAETLSRGALPRGSPFLAMEYAEGGSLEAYCGTLPSTTVKDVLGAVLRALACAHARGVLHRDVKPGNVLVCGPDPSAGVRLADFGLAAPLGDEIRDLHAGTPAYMAPEQLAGAWRDFGPWTDLWAVAGTAVVLAGAAEPRLEAVAELSLPPGWAEWIARGLAPDPADRWRHAADAAAALALLPDGALPARPGRRPIAPATFDLDDVVLPAAVAAPVRVTVPVPRRLSAGIPSRDPPPTVPEVVGRDAELAELAAALDAVVASGRPGVRVVCGDRGIGKTLLVRHFAETVAEAGRASVVLDGPGSAARTARRIAHRALRAEGLADRALEARLTACVARMPIPREQHADLVAALAGSASADRETRHDAVLRCLGAEDRPVVVVADDVRDGDDVVAFAGGLLRPDAVGRVLVLLVAAEDLPELPAGAPRIRRGPLAPPSFEQVLAVRGLDPAAAAVVARMAGGNPQLAQAIVEDWRDRALLVDGPWGLAVRPGVAPDTPAGLRVAWEGRVASFVGDAAARHGPSARGAGGAGRVRRSARLEARARGRGVSGRP